MKNALLFCVLGWHISAYSDAIDMDSRVKLAHIFSNENSHSVYQSADDKIKAISSFFIGTQYNNSTLNRSYQSPETLVVNMNEVDCLTFIEYLEALKQSIDFSSFESHLAAVRYFHSQVRFEKRKHFFSDWLADPDYPIIDVTDSLSGEVVMQNKFLNQTEDGYKYIYGVNVKERVIHYIPEKNVTQSVLDKLKTGDYVGIYSNKLGLDVSHVGIIIRENNVLYFRNASSMAKNRKVVDIPLIDYLRNKPGIVVYRSLAGKMRSNY